MDGRAHMQPLAGHMDAHCLRLKKYKVGWLGGRGGRKDDTARKVEKCISKLIVFLMLGTGAAVFPATGSTYRQA